MQDQLGELRRDGIAEAYRGTVRQALDDSSWCSRAWARVCGSIALEPDKKQESIDNSKG